MELITREDGTVSALIDGREVTLREALGTLALSVYGKDMEMAKEKDADKKKSLEDEITFQTMVLDSLSNAYSAAIHC